MTEALAEESHAAKVQTADNFMPGADEISQIQARYKRCELLRMKQWS
jgi:hypothetical protein